MSSRWWLHERPAKPPLALPLVLDYTVWSDAWTSARRISITFGDFSFYLDPFRYGAPPHGGLGLGVERLTMQLLGIENIREATLLPRDRYRLTP